VLVRNAAEIAQLVAQNPFPREPGNRVMALITDDPLPDNPLTGAAGLGQEQVRTGPRALFIHYPDGMANTRLRLPAARSGTARNMNTITKLAEMAASLA